MNFDRLLAFMGKPINFYGVDIYSPTVNEISSISELQYRLFLIFSTFDKEKILQNIFKVSDDDYEMVENTDDYEVLTGHPVVSKYISEAISFLTKKEVMFDGKTKSFFVLDDQNKSKYFLSEKNYLEFQEVVYNLNGLEKKEKTAFKNDRVKKKYKQMMALKNQYNKGNDFELKDMLSVLCNADGNGINIFNIGELTMYQVHEQFERLSIKEKHYRVLQVWANGLLKENDKLPEWIIKTKL